MINYEVGKLINYSFKNNLFAADCSYGLLAPLQRLQVHVVVRPLRVFYQVHLSLQLLQVQTLFDNQLLLVEVEPVLEVEDASCDCEQVLPEGFNDLDCLAGLLCLDLQLSLLNFLQQLIYLSVDSIDYFHNERVRAYYLRQSPLAVAVHENQEIVVRHSVEFKQVLVDFADMLLDPGGSECGLLVLTDFLKEELLQGGDVHFQLIHLLGELILVVFDLVDSVVHQHDSFPQLFVLDVAYFSLSELVLEAQLAVRHMCWHPVEVVVRIDRLLRCKTISLIVKIHYYFQKISKPEKSRLVKILLGSWARGFVLFVFFRQRFVDLGLPFIHQFLMKILLGFLHWPGPGVSWTDFKWVQRGIGGCDFKGLLKQSMIQYWPGPILQKDYVQGNFFLFLSTEKQYFLFGLNLTWIVMAWARYNTFYLSLTFLLAQRKSSLFVNCYNGWLIKSHTGKRFSGFITFLILFFKSKGTRVERRARSKGG